MEFHKFVPPDIYSQSHNGLIIRPATRPKQNNMNQRPTSTFNFPGTYNENLEIQPDQEDRMLTGNDVETDTHMWPWSQGVDFSIAKERIRKFGYTYLKPPGVTKTMATMEEEYEEEGSSAEYDFSEQNMDAEEGEEESMEHADQSQEEGEDEEEEEDQAERNLDDELEEGSDFGVDEEDPFMVDDEYEVDDSSDEDQNDSVQPVPRDVIDLGGRSD